MKRKTEHNSWWHLFIKEIRLGRLEFDPMSNHTKDQKIVNKSLLNSQYYKVHIKGKMKQSREKSSDLPYTSV